MPAGHVQKENTGIHVHYIAARSGSQGANGYAAHPPPGCLLSCKSGRIERHFGLRSLLPYGISETDHICRINTRPLE